MQVLSANINFWILAKNRTAPATGVLVELVVIRMVGLLSSVGIVTRYWLDGSGFETRWRRDFPQPSSPALGPTQPRVQRVFGSFFSGCKATRAWRWPSTSIQRRGWRKIWVIVQSPLCAFNRDYRVNFTFMISLRLIFLFIDTKILRWAKFYESRSGLWPSQSGLCMNPHISGGRGWGSLFYFGF